MADRRPDSQEMSQPKRQKKNDPVGEFDPNNPYEAHHFENPYENGNSKRNGYSNGGTVTSLSNFKRHATTAEQANTAEEGPNNPFNNVPLSDRYFDIWKTRKDLPVHKQR